MIVSFFGVDHKAGTTMITQSVADAIAHNDPSISVVRLSLHNRMGLDFFSHAAGVVDDLLISLENRCLNLDLFETVSCKSGSMRVLGGLRDISLSRKFGVEEVKYLLDFVKDTYDIVIIDAGADMDNALTTGALVCSDQMFYVGTQSESCLSQFFQISPIVKYCCPVEPSAVILNKFIMNEVYNLQYVSKRLNLPKEVFRMVIMAEDALKAERDHVSFFGRRNRQYDADILILSDMITSAKGVGPLKRNGGGLKQFLGLTNLRK